MEKYPDSKETPHRATRKKLRKDIFWRNSQEGNRIRRERKLAKEKSK